MTDIDPRDLLVDDTLSVDPVTGEEVVGPVLHGRTRRLVLRGGPGSGHFGHEGRPGQVGGSQPGDFHSAEPGSYGKGIDAAAMEVFLAGLTVVPTDADWLENWFIDRKAEADPLEKEVVVGPSGKAFDVEPFGGHESAGDNALTALGTVLSKERGVEIVLKPVEGGEFDIETYDESVGPEGDGWDRNEKGELTFQFLSHMPGERKLSPIKYFFERNEDDGKLHLMVSQSWDSVRASMLGNVATNALELSGRDPFVAWDTEEQAKQYLEAELFGKVSTFSIDVYGLPGEGRSYRFTRLPPEMLESLGLDPAKNIVPDYNWTDSRLPPFLASSVEEASDELRKYVSGRARPAGEAYRPNYGMGGVDGENALLSMGFMRISRGGLTSNSAPEIGISWNRTAGLTDAQRGVALRVVRDTIKRDGRVAWERLKGYDIERQNWGDRPGGMFSELPNNKFTAALQGQDVENWVERSSADLPAWALRLLIPRGGPGSGHFAHEGRPGQVGGSQPGDFHSAAGRPLEPIDTTWLSEHTEIPATLWNQTEDPKRIAEWLERYYEKSTDPTDEFYLTPDGVAYNVNEREPAAFDRGIDAEGHGEVGQAALKSLIEKKKDSGELVPPDLEEAKKGLELVRAGSEADLSFTKFRTEDKKHEEYAATIGLRNRFYELIVWPENEERTEWHVDFLDTGIGRPETISATESDLPEHIAGRLYSYKVMHEVQDKETGYRLATVYEAWPGSEEAKKGKPFSAVTSYDGPVVTTDFETRDEAEKFAIDEAAKSLIGQAYHFRMNTDYEEAMAAFGFIRVSRGGSGGSQVGMTIDQYLGPTPAQARFLTKIAREAIENSGSVAWQAGRASGAIEEWPSNEFTSAMQGNFTVRSVYSLPAWAQRVLILRGGKGSGHRGHAGRPGRVGGSQPGDFHSGSNPSIPEGGHPSFHWPKTKPWDATQADIEAGKIPGLRYDPRMSAGIVAHYYNKPDITVGPLYFEDDAFSRNLLLYHELGHEVANRVTRARDLLEVDVLRPFLRPDYERLPYDRMFDNFVGASGRAEEFLADVYTDLIHGGRSHWESPKYTDVYDAVAQAAAELLMPSTPQFAYDPATGQWVERGGPGSGHHGHEGREGKRGGSAPGDRATVEAPVGKDRKAQMDEAKRRKDFQSAKPATTPKAEPLGAQAPHIGPGYRVHLTNEAFAKYRAQVSSALEWASSEFKRAFGGQVEGVTIYDDSPTYVEACDPQLWSESLADKGAEFVQQVKDGLREDYGRFYGAYNHVAKAMFVNTGKFIEPSGVLDTESMTKTALHEYIHWGTVGSGRDEIWKEVEVPRAFRSAFKADYPQDLLKQEYVARVVSAELMGSDLLTNPTDTASIDMSEEDHENARVLIDKISNAFVAPNLEMPTTLRAAPPTERMVDVGIPDGLGNVWGRAIPESALDSLPDGAHVTSVYTILKGEEAFEDGRTIRPDALSLNWLDETDPARHPVRQPITKEPRPDDVTMARRSQDTVLDRVLDTIGGALRELMGMKNG